MLDVISIIKEYSYIGIFVIVFLECGIFFLLPGDSLLFAVGLLASRGYISFTLALTTIVIAGILGGNVGFFLGKYLEQIMEYRHLKRFFPKDKIDKVKIFFDTNGDKAILICRFIPFARTFTPWVAGFSEMKFSTFWKYNIIGGIIWGIFIPTTGYLFGNSFPVLEHNVSLISVTIVIISLLPFIIKFFKNKLRKSL